MPKCVPGPSCGRLSPRPNLPPQTAKVLDEHVETISGHVSVWHMHLEKGLEFRAVAVMACDDEIIPLQERIETVGDDADLQEVYDTERHLLYSLGRAIICIRVLG
jgi:hypothetical protein